MTILSGKVAIITGGTRGLGYGIAEAYLKEGASILIASRSKDNVTRAVTSLKQQYENVIGFPCDISHLEEVQALSNHAINEFGRFDIWVNNAGISCPTGPTVHIPPQMVTNLVKTNILGAYYGSIVAMQQFLKQGNGKLINMVGKGERSPVALHNPYASSRAWVHNFSLAMAKEYKATGVGVYLLNPGLVETDMLQYLHFIEGYEHLVRTLRVVTRILARPPEFAAKKAVWLASSATDGRTGMRISALGIGAVLSGLVNEVIRIIQRKKPPPFAPKIDLIKPAIDYPLINKKRRKRDKPYPPDQWISKLDKKSLPEKIGTKATHLHQLQKNKYRIPQTFVLSWDAHHMYQNQGQRAFNQLQKELDKIIEPNKAYAVRSSANIEDNPQHSFAGVFQTVLNVHTKDEMLDAIQRVWDSTCSETIKSYQEHTPPGSSEIKMGVILQEMIQPKISGVAFSKNPITALDEVVIEAVEGLGTQLVQDGITPHRWVNKWGNWIEKPEQNRISQEVIDQVAQATIEIAQAVKKDIDLEWVYDGQNIYWLQMRDITTLSKENIYSNKMSKEMTPGLIKPLVWSVTIHIKASVWIDFFTQIMGKQVADPKSLAKSIHYRAYHNIGVFGKIFEGLGMPRESLEIMLGVAPKDAGKPSFKPSMKMIRLLPRIVLFLHHKWTFGKKAEKEYPVLLAESKDYPIPPDDSFSSAQILSKIDQIGLLNKRATDNTIISILLMQFYNRILGTLLKSIDVDFQQFDLTEGMDELRYYDPSHHMIFLNELAKNQDQCVREMIFKGDIEILRATPEAENFMKQFDRFISDFGHMSDATGDFGTTPWRETPDLILKLIADYQPPTEQTVHKKTYTDLKRSGLKGLLIPLFYKRARQFRLFREKYSSIFTYSLMLFRAYYLAIGKRFKEQNWLQDSHDILYLFDEEVRSFIEGQNSGEDFSALVTKRKKEMELAKHIIMPEIVFGEQHPPIIMSIGETLSGTPTSRGYYTGKVKVIQGISDFPKLEDGDVLVIPYSDVSWLPLFSKAGAVIAESGGILSHSSIIAREYGIPAVVSVNGALSLCDNSIVSIDGFKGEILIHKD